MSMDAATLYIVMAVGSGPKRMTTTKFPTIQICKDAADKMRKRASMKDATVYCVKRAPDKGEKRLAAQAAAQAAAARKRMQAGQAQAQQQQAATPPGLPREFFSGTTPKM
jgi:hypothetical protein